MSPLAREDRLRRWGELAVAALVTLVADRWLGLAAGDPFRGTLLLLPALVFAFRELARAGRRRGGLSLAPRATATEGVALLLLVALVLARRSLGLAGLGPTGGPGNAILAAGFLLVLAHRLAIQLLALRPLLGRRLPARPSALFFLLPLAAYLAILPWSAGHRQPDGDEPFYLLMTHSLAYDGDADLTNNYAENDWRYFMERPIEPQPGDPVGPHGELYSRHNDLLPLVLAPAYRLAGKAGALVVMAMLSAALAWTVLRLGRHYWPERPGEALLAYALVAFGSPLIVYSYQVWVEVPAALLSALALDQILALKARPPWGWRRWLAVSTPILLLPLVKIRFMLLAVPLLALGWWHAGRPKKPLLILGGLLAAVGAGLLIHNQLLYHNPLKIHTVEEIELYKYPPSSYLKGAVGLFYDTAFGLFGVAPVWLLLVPALLLLLRRRRGSLLFDTAVFSFPYMLIVAPRAEWYGGWSPPFRYALVLLPLLGLALVPLLERRHRPGARALLAGLGLLTLALTLLWVVVPGWTYDFANGRTYLLDGLDSRLGTDVARLFPSYVRWRSASWVWPLATLLLVPLAWWLPRPRLRRPALLGVAGLALGTALVPLAAAHLPTHVVEAEDPWAAKTGGHLYPDTWVIERTRYRGGWTLRSREKLTAPVVAGGRQVTLTLYVRFVRNVAGPLPLDVRAGERRLGRWVPGPEDEGVWRRVEIGPVDWPEGAPLVLQAESVPYLNGVIVDKVVFRWR